MPVKPKALISTFDSASPPTAFFDWVAKNGGGFFINTFQETSERYVKLHSAKCGIATSDKRYGPGGATQRAYKKICSQSPNALIDHLVSRYGVPFEEDHSLQEVSGPSADAVPARRRPR